MQFVDFRTIDDICLQDERMNIFDDTPFNQLSTRIAFLTRVEPVCKESDCKGDIIINLLEVDPYSKPMECKWHKSRFEACMKGGVRDDQMIKA